MKPTKLTPTKLTSKGPQLYIGGEFRAANRSEPVLEAATGELLSDGATATEADIDAAVAAARAALPQWSALHQRAASTTELVSQENGMPMRLSRSANGLFPAALLGYYATLITETPIVQGLKSVSLVNNGQTCFLGSRILAPRSRYWRGDRRAGRAGRRTDCRQPAGHGNRHRPGGERPAA